MSQKKQAANRRRRKRGVPALGAAAGLSLSLASGVSAATGGTTGMSAQNTQAGHAVSIYEEEISDVSLATFYVFEREGDQKSPPKVKLVFAGGCGCVGCAGCGGCWTGNNYTSSMFGDNQEPHHPVKPAQKPAHARKGANKSKDQ